MRCISPTKPRKNTLISSGVTSFRTSTCSRRRTCSQPIAIAIASAAGVTQAVPVATKVRPTCASCPNSALTTHGITCAICTDTWLPFGSSPVAISASTSRIQCSCGGRKFAT